MALGIGFFPFIGLDWLGWGLGIKEIHWNRSKKSVASGSVWGAWPPEISSPYPLPFEQAPGVFSCSHPRFNFIVAGRTQRPTIRSIKRQLRGIYQANNVMEMFGGFEAVSVVLEWVTAKGKVQYESAPEPLPPCTASDLDGLDLGGC